MVRHLKAIGTVIACLVIGCAVTPRVVVVVTPYVPILHLNPATHRWLGAMTCDLQGQPVIWLHPALDKESARYVLLHEMIHVEQAKAWGGCMNFDRRVRADSMFRLRVEGESYCGVYSAQRRSHVQPWPTYDSIVRQLVEDYGFNYERDSAIAAMPCRR